MELNKKEMYLLYISLKQYENRHEGDFDDDEQQTIRDLAFKLSQSIWEK